MIAGSRKGVGLHGLAFPLLLLLILCGFYWKLLFTYQYDWLWGPDLTMQVLPWFEEQSHQLHHSQVPLWDTHEWGGQPLPGQAQPGTFYPLNWILWLMPHQGAHIPMSMLNWYYVAIHYMAALFTYLLCRDLGRSRPAALAAGIIFALSGYVGKNDWPQMVNGAVWTPLIFLFLLRSVRGVRPVSSAALCGLFLGMAWLAGHHQVPIFLTLASALVWIYYILRSGKFDLRMAGLALMAMTFSVLVGAIQILPAREFGQLALRWVGTPNPMGWNDAVPYYVHRDHSLHPYQLFGIFIPGLDQSADPFLGVVAFSLALLGLGMCWKHPEVKIFAALAVGGVLYAIGPHSVFSGLIYAVVPFVEKARVPAMALFLFQAGAAVLAAYGMDQLRASTDIPWLNIVLRGVSAAGRLLVLVLLFVLVSKKFSWDMDDRVVITALVTLLLAGLLYGWRAGGISSRQGFTLLTLLILFELGNDAGFTLSDRHDWEQRKFIERVRGNPDLADFFHGQQKNGPFRVETQTEDIYSNWADYYDVDFLHSYAGVTVNTWNLEMHTWPTRMLYGVRYTLARDPTHDGQREVFQGASGIKVYENPEAFPRAWAVHEVVSISDVAKGRAFVNDHGAELRSKVLTLGNAPTLQQCPDSPDQVSVTRYRPSSVSITASMGCGGMVILADTFYPGWRATVDGTPTPIQEVDMALRGVLVAKGRHEIRFDYRPWSVYLGALMTFFGVAGAIALAVFDRRRPRELTSSPGPSTAA
ncbi:MAG: YfhO family protein [Acidobacteriota bacterium]|nr:YfhO family protein [Acidobacteriota bacterium]